MKYAGARASILTRTAGNVFAIVVDPARCGREEACAAAAPGQARGREPGRRRSTRGRLRRFWYRRRRGVISGSFRQPDSTPSPVGVEQLRQLKSAPVQTIGNKQANLGGLGRQRNSRGLGKIDARRAVFGQSISERRRESGADLPTTETPASVVLWLRPASVRLTDDACSGQAWTGARESLPSAAVTGVDVRVARCSPCPRLDQFSVEAAKPPLGTENRAPPR